MAKFVWQDGTLVSKAKVKIGGTIYEVDPEEYSGSTPLSASNLNAMVDSTYSDLKDYVDKKQTYSTDEIVIGTYLGKPLYRKVLTGTLPTGKGENNFNLPSECLIKRKYGRIKSILGGIFELDTYYAPSAAYSISSWIAADEHTLKVECGANYSKSSKYEITVEYTKTTDEATA